MEERCKYSLTFPVVFEFLNTILLSIFLTWRDGKTTKRPTDTMTTASANQPRKTNETPAAQSLAGSRKDNDELVVA